MGVTAGAISRHVGLLEVWLDRRLFDRMPRSVALTTDGAALMPVLVESLDMLEAGMARLVAERPRAVLAVNVQTSFAIGWLLPRLASLHRAHPEIELRVSTAIDTPDLGDGAAPDAAVVHGRGPWPDLASHFLFPDRLVPVCASQWLAARAGLDLRGMPGETLLVSDTAPTDWEQWFAHAGRRGVRPDRPMRFASSLLPPQAAMHGLGVALADLSLVQAELASGRLVNPLPAVPPMLRGTGWHLIHTPVRGQEPPVASLRDWLLREVAG